MDFALTPEQHAFRQEIRAFLAQELAHETVVEDGWIAGFSFGSWVATTDCPTASGSTPRSRSAATNASGGASPRHCVSRVAGRYSNAPFSAMIHPR